MKQIKSRKKILYLQQYGAASVSVRSTLYRDLYRRKGYRVVYRSWDTLPVFLFLARFCPPVCKKIFDKTRIIFIRIYQYLILHLEVKRYDGIVIMKYFPYETVALIRKNTKAELLYDFDDPIWLDMFSPMLKRYRDIISCVDCVSVDNRYLYDVAVKYNSNVFIFPPPAQFEKLPEIKNKRNDGIVTIGWIGSDATSYLFYTLHSVLEEIGKKYENVKLLLLGFPLPVLPFFENIKWEIIQEYDENIMNRAREKIDIGLFPLLPGINSYGRGLCKPVMYMGASIPVIATDYGLVSGLIQDGVNGFLCKNEEEWRNKLSLLIENASLRHRIGDAGFDSVKKYSLENNFGLLEDHFLSKLSSEAEFKA